MKNIALTATVLFFLINMPVFTQTEESATGTASSPDFIFFTFGTTAMLNAEGLGTTTMELPADGSYGGFKSAPSPIFFTPGVGFNIPRTTLVTFSPRLQFSLNYYLWNGECALPAEIEHRTAIAPSIMIDLPAAIHFSAASSIFSVGLGIGIFARIGFLPQGVPSSCEDDVSDINSWFWSDLHFLYPLALFSWEYKLKNNWTAGIDLRAYYPIANAVKASSYGSGIANALDTGMISISIRIAPPIKNWKI